MDHTHALHRGKTSIYTSLLVFHWINSFSIWYNCISFLNLEVSYCCKAPGHCTPMCHPLAGCRCCYMTWQLPSHTTKVLTNKYSYPFSTEALLATTFLCDWKCPELLFNLLEVNKHLQESWREMLMNGANAHISMLKSSFAFRGGILHTQVTRGP